VQPVIRFKLKVGNKYLKQTVAVHDSADFSNDSGFGDIRIPTGNVVTGGTDITTWLPLEITTDVEWSDTEAWFEIPFLVPDHMDTEVETLEYDDGSGSITEFPCGLYCVAHETNANQQRFRNQNRFQHTRTLHLDITLPEMDNNISVHTGVSLDAEITAYKNEGTQMTEGEVNGLFSCWVQKLELANGDAGTDEDTVYYATHTTTNGTETVEVGTTLLATRPASRYGPIGALTVGSGHRSSSVETDGFGKGWFSERGDTFPTSSSGSANLHVISKAHFALRYNSLDTYDIELLLRDHHHKLLYPGGRVVIEQGGSDVTIQIQACSHDLMAGRQTVQGYLVQSEYTGVSLVDSLTNADPLPDRVSSGRFNPGPISVVKNKTGGGSGTLSADDQAKLAAITMSGSAISDFTVASGQKPLTADEVEDASSTHKFATQSELNAIASNTAALTDIQAVFKETTSGDGVGVFINTSSNTESHVAVTSTTGKLQAGENTKFELSETSPGTIALKVQAGATGSEAAVTAMSITGSSTQNTKATVNFPAGDFRVSSPAQFNQPVTFSGGSNTITFVAATSGIDYADLDNTPTLPGSPLADADQTISGGTTREIVLSGGTGQIAKLNIVDAQGNILESVQAYGNGVVIQEKYGALAVRSTTLFQGSVALYEAAANGINSLSIKAPASVSSNKTFVLPDSYGTNGQHLTTDGTGTLSWASGSGGSSGPIFLTQVGGRYMWSSADDGERVWTGQGSYGPTNWYSFSSEPGNSTLRTYSASHAVDSTTASINHWELIAYGIRIPTTDKKVKIHYAFRLQNAPASSTWGISLWGADHDTSGNASSRTLTLRGETADVTHISNSSSRVYHGTLTTTSDFAEDFCMLLAENRTGSLTTTTYMIASFTFELVD